MSELKKITLPTGSVLEMNIAPFADSKALYQAVAEEMMKVQLDPDRKVESALKDLICLGLSSQKIEMRINKCMERALYNGVKIDSQTFEPEKARDDYFMVCFEVAKVNVMPFMKSLYAQYKPILETLIGTQA